MITKVNNRLLLYLFFFLAINGFVIYFINRERYIYHWDSAFYWFQYQNIRELFATDPLKALKTLWYSLRNEDHNLLAVFLLTPFNFHLFGNDRLAFVSSITNIFAFPSAISFVLLMENISRHFNRGVSFAIPLLTMSTVFLIPEFWIPVLSGFYDVVGILIINLILLLYITAPLEKQKFSNLILLGVLLSLLVLLRRYYAYWVVSFFIALAGELFFSNFKRHHFSVKDYLPPVRNILIVGITSLVVFLSIAAPAAKTMFLTDFADVYTAYRKISSISQIVMNFYGYFGPFVVLLFLLGVMQAVLDKDMRKFAFFLIAQFTITALLFLRTQDFGYHHYYLLLPTMFIFISLFVITLFDNLKKGLNALFLIGYIAFLVMNFSFVFIPMASEHLGSIAYLFPKIKYHPLVRNDLKEIDTLLGTLENLSKDNGDLIYVLSSSGRLNSDILRNACLSNKRLCTIRERILLTHDVDKRDGFPQQFLTARYVIVTDPVQYHLRPNDQRVIGVLAGKLLNQEGIGSSYKKLPYHTVLDGNVNTYIYEKVTAFKKSDLTSLSQQFIHYYPDKKEKFEINTMCHLISKRTIGDGYGKISCQKDVIYLIPGPNKSSTVSLKLQRKYHDLRMVFAFDNPEKIPISCGDKAGEVNLTIRSDGKTILHKHIDFKHPVDYRLDVSVIDVLEITADKGEYGPACDWFMLKNIHIE